MAWTEVSGHIPAGAIVMWIGAIAWQIGYDTVYAYVDVKDDARLGLKVDGNLVRSEGQSLYWSVIRPYSRIIVVRRLVIGHVAIIRCWNGGDRRASRLAGLAY